MSLTSANVSPSSTKEVFIVRLWREKRSSPTWLGQIQHIRTGHTVYVSGPQELVDYIQNQMDQVDPIATTKRGLK